MASDTDDSAVEPTPDEENLIEIGDVSPFAASAFGGSTVQFSSTHTTEENRLQTMDYAVWKRGKQQANAINRLASEVKQLRQVVKKAAGIE